MFLNREGGMSYVSQVAYDIQQFWKMRMLVMFVFELSEDHY